MLLQLTRNQALITPNPNGTRDQYIAWMLSLVEQSINSNDPGCWLYGLKTGSNRREETQIIYTSYADGINKGLFKSPVQTSDQVLMIINFILRRSYPGEQFEVQVVEGPKETSTFDPTWARFTFS